MATSPAACQHLSERLPVLCGILSSVIYFLISNISQSGISTEVEQNRRYGGETRVRRRAVTFSAPPSFIHSILTLLKVDFQITLLSQSSFPAFPFRFILYYSASRGNIPQHESVEQHHAALCLSTLNFVLTNTALLTHYNT